MNTPHLFSRFNQALIVLLLPAALMIAAPAQAQSTANVSVTGRITGNCQVTTSSVTIALGNVAASSLGAVGSASPISSPQNVSLTCTASPGVTMSMSGTSAGITPNTVLALTGTPAASGVGVQLFYNNGTAPMVIGQGYSVNSTAPTTLTIPIAARYYVTGAVKAGTANANAVLSFTFN